MEKPAWPRAACSLPLQGSGKGAAVGLCLGLSNFSQAGRKVFPFLGERKAKQVQLVSLGISFHF